MLVVKRHRDDGPCTSPCSPKSTVGKGLREQFLSSPMPPRKEKRRGAVGSQTASSSPAVPEPSSDAAMNLDSSCVASPVPAPAATGAPSSPASHVAAPTVPDLVPTSPFVSASAAPAVALDAPVCSTAFVARVESLSTTLQQRLDDVSRLRTSDAEVSLAALTSAWQEKSSGACGMILSKFEPLRRRPTNHPAAQETLIATLRAELLRVSEEFSACGYVPPGAVRASPLYRSAEAAAQAAREENESLKARGMREGRRVIWASSSTASCCASMPLAQWHPSLTPSPPSRGPSRQQRQRQRTRAQLRRPLCKMQASCRLVRPMLRAAAGLAVTRFPNLSRPVLSGLPASHSRASSPSSSSRRRRGAAAPGPPPLPLLHCRPSVWHRRGAAATVPSLAPLPIARSSPPTPSSAPLQPSPSCSTSSTRREGRTRRLAGGPRSSSTSPWAAALRRACLPSSTGPFPSQPHRWGRVGCCSRPRPSSNGPAAAGAHVHGQGRAGAARGRRRGGGGGWGGRRR